MPGRSESRGCLDQALQVALQVACDGDVVLEALVARDADADVALVIQAALLARDGGAPLAGVALAILATS